MALISGKNDNILIKYTYPSLYIDFAKSKLSRDRVTKDGDILVFSRETGGTYIEPDGLMLSASADEPRYEHDSITKDSIGLLIEEERTNTIRYSEDFSFTGSTEVSGWVSPVDVSAIDIDEVTPLFPNVTGTLASNAGISPDGLQTADLLTSDNLDVPGFSPKGWAQKVNVISAPDADNVYTIFSIYIKNLNSIKTRIQMSRESSNFLLELNWSGSTFESFDEQTAYSDDTLTFKYGYQELSSSWYRFWIGCEPVEPDPNIMIFPEITQGVTGSAYFWGAQLEQAYRNIRETNVPTSYLKTTDSPVTRKRDKAKIVDRPLPESGFKFRRMYNQDVGTLFIDANWNYDAQYASTSRYAITLLDENDSDSFTSIVNFGDFTSPGDPREPGSAGGIIINSGSSVNIFEQDTNYTGSNFMRTAIVIKQDDCKHIYSGSSVVLSSSEVDIPRPTQLWIGSKNGDDDDRHILNGHVKRFVYWPRKVVDEGLEEMTEKDW